MKEEDNFDFGFSFVEETDDDQRILSDQEQIENLKIKLDKLYNSIIPFLNNLCKDPEKATIHWPNRVEKINAYKEKLKQILEE